jgi:hypothetical protein
MKAQHKQMLKSFAIELALYSVVMVGYFYLVLHLLGHWLQDLFNENKMLYAFIALGLIIGQGVALEMLTTGLLRLINSRSNTRD